MSVAGLRQGRNFCPVLFSSAIDEVIRCKGEFKKYYMGYNKIVPRNVKIFLLGDDVTVKADNE